MGMHVILVGTPRDGYRVIGPFKTGSDAHDFINPNRTMHSGPRADIT